MILKQILYSLVFTLISILLFPSCGQSNQKKQQQDDWNIKNTRDLYPTDPSFLAAVKSAQDNIDILIRLVKSKQDNHFDFYVKSKFSESGKVEHMWSEVYSLSEDSFQVTLDNVPKNLGNFKYGQSLRIHKSDVEDWLVYQKDSLIQGDFMKQVTK
jgi:uncharacterized protein YegJ (DUF2314 family)